MPSVVEGGRGQGSREGYEAHAGPGAEMREPSSSGVRDRGQRLPFITSKLGNAEDSMGQP